jgi:cyanate permease
LLGLAFCSWVIEYFALIVWLPTFLAEQHAIGQMMVGLLSAGVVIIHAPGNLLGGALVRRHFHRGKLILFANTIGSLLSVGVYLDLLPDILRYLASLELSFCGGLISASVISSTEDLDKNPCQIGTLQGLFIQCAYLGQFIGPPLIALLVARSGIWGDALWVTGSAVMIGIFLGWLSLTNQAISNTIQGYKSVLILMAWLVIDKGRFVNRRRVKSDGLIGWLQQQLMLRCR